MNKSKEQNNYSEKYNCQKCRDLTFIIEGNVATTCECREVKIAKEILDKSGISEEFRRKTFKNYNYSYNIQTIEAFTKATNYVKEFKHKLPSRNNSIIFLGQVGSGKTHLSLSIANSLINKNIGVIYMPYRETIIKLKQNILDSEYYNKAINRYKNAKVLLIDDLFKGNVTGSDINIMFEIINHRYFNNLPIIISSEKYVNDLLEIDEAIGSRIIEMSKGNIIEYRGKKLNYRIYG
ncbi:MAG: ATP-binding protein [Peptostreptococcaceae bacterium]